jgi:hypothetical protein
MMMEFIIMCRYYAAYWKREGEERVKAVSFAGALVGAL